MVRALIFLFVVLSSPAWAALLRLEGEAPDLRAALKIGDKDYSLPVKLLRSKTPAAAGALLVDIAQQNELTDMALARGMSVARFDLDALPTTARVEALRDLLPPLREKTAAKRALGRGTGPSGEALIATADLFDGLLLQRDAPFAAPVDTHGPKIIDAFGSDAYWRPAAPVETEAPEGANRRRFFITGTASGAGGNCVAPASPGGQAPALRALLVVLDDWTKGTAPPASRATRLHAPGLVPAKSLLWPKIPGLPATPADPRPVPTIDADGNEKIGLRLPDRQLPIATFIGFGAQKDKSGPLCAAGAVLPFAANKADREKSGDPRPSLVERYGSRAYFVATMRVVADRLVKERLLLKEDADAYVAAARQAPF